MTVLIFIYFNSSFRKGSKVLEKTNRIININLVVILFNVIVLGLLGIGFSSYVNFSEELSNKGFFYSGNELSALMLVLFSYVIFKSYHNQWKYKLLLIILLLITAFLSGSKTAMLGTISLCIFIPKIAVRKRKKTIVKKIMYLFAVIIIVASAYIYITSSEIWNRWYYFYDKGGISLFLFSGRFTNVANEIPEYLNAALPFQIIGLGGGGREGTVEIDFFDVLFNFGVLGVFIIYGFYFTILENARRLRKNKNYPYAKLSFVTLIIVLCVSFFAGHVIFSGMVGIFIGILCALTFYKKRDDKNINCI
jgi:O-antigen ligase